MKIESGVPVLRRKYNKHIEEMDGLFKKMKVGESLLVSGVKIGTISVHAWATFGAGSYTIRRSLTPLGYRVWRLA